MKDFSDIANVQFILVCGLFEGIVYLLSRGAASRGYFFPQVPQLGSLTAIRHPAPGFGKGINEKLKKN